MRSIWISLSAIAVLSLSVTVRADPVLTFLNDYDGFLEAAGDVQEIDFETLPDGTPSVQFTPITPEFNYTDQGVTFSSGFPVLEIGTPFMGDFPLITGGGSGGRNWIIADLVTAATAVGYFFPGSSDLYAYDAGGALIDSASFVGSGQGFFLGMVSGVPISRVIGDRGSSGEIFESFLFTPVPEPATLVFLTLGAAAVLRRRR